MATTAEEKYYEQILNNAPKANASNAALLSESALNKVESEGIPSNYSGTYQDRLNKAIGEWLNSKGFKYESSADDSYRQYANQYRQNAEAGRQQSINTANMLANGYAPTYANAVANEVYNSQTENISDAVPTFKNLAAQEYAAQQNQAANAVNIYNTADTTQYNRSRDIAGDYKNYLSYLYDRYNADRESDIQKQSYDASIYDTQLTSAQSNLDSAKSNDLSRYLYDTQSADSKAQIAENEYENNQKIAYSKAEDEYNKAKAEYDAKTKAAKNEKSSIEKGKTENANAILASMGVSEDDFKSDGSLYDESGGINYTIYAKTYIDTQHQKGYLNDDELAYLYDKLGVTSDGSSYNSEIADGFYNTFGLGESNDEKYLKGTIIQGYNEGTLSSADVSYLSAKLGFNI